MLDLIDFFIYQFSIKANILIEGIPKNWYNDVSHISILFKNMISRTLYKLLISKKQYYLSPLHIKLFYPSNTIEITSKKQLNSYLESSLTIVTKTSN